MPTSLLRVWVFNNARLGTGLLLQSGRHRCKTLQSLGGGVLIADDAIHEERLIPTAGSSEPRLYAIPFRNAASIVSVAVTNLFIDAFRDPVENDALQRFHAAFAPHELFSAIVGHELKTGVRSPEDSRLDRHVL